MTYILLNVLVTSSSSSSSFHLISRMISFLHPQLRQCSVACHAHVLVRLLARGVAPFRPAAMRGFRSHPVKVAASQGAIHLAYSSPRAMTVKRKGDDGKLVVHSAGALRTLSSAITSYGSAEVALLHTHGFHTSLLRRVLTGLSIIF
jgi:hypothetical protein